MYADEEGTAVHAIPMPAFEQFGVRVCVDMEGLGGSRSYRSRESRWASLYTTQSILVLSP
jgi:hypothetical protein